MEQLRSSILQTMSGHINAQTMIILENALDLYFNEYEIIKKNNDIMVLDNHNQILLKNFLGVKHLNGCSNRTIEYYKSELNALLYDLGKNVEDIITNDIRCYLASRQIKGNLTMVTLNNMRRVYSSFFSWLELEEYIKVNPMKRIPSFKTHKKQIQPFSDKELAKLFNSCDNVRDRALLEFLYSTGIRLTECVNTNLNDLDIKHGEIFIRKGKGNKERIAYISDVSCMYLENYLQSRVDTDNALWIGKRGRLTARGIECIVSRIGEKAKVDNAHPHRFRHTLATNLVKRGAPLQIVQQILGHENIDTTTIYVTINNDEIHNIHKKLIV